MQAGRRLIEVPPPLVAKAEQLGRDAGKTAAVICDNNHFRVVIDGETAAVVPRTTTSEIHRYKANATDKRYQARPTPQGR